MFSLFESCVISAHSKAGRHRPDCSTRFESCVISAHSKAAQYYTVQSGEFESCVISAHSKAYVSELPLYRSLRAV